MAFRLLHQLCPVLVLLSFLSEGVFGRDVDLVGRQGTTVSEQSSSGNVVTSTSSAATVTPSAILTFNTINQLTTCTSTSITWFYMGPDSPMSLTVTNLNVPQSGSSSLSGASTSTVSPGVQILDTVTVKLASALNPTSLNFTWPSVNVPQGWYRLYAGIDSQSFIQTSAAFFVSTGSSTSCLVTAASTSHPLPSSSTTTTPLLVSSSSSPINTGAIVGIVIGSLGLLFAVAAAFFCFRRRYRKRSKKGGGGGLKGWSGLKSTDSHTGLQVYNNKASHHPSQVDSLQPAIMGSDEGTDPEDKLSASPGKYSSPYDHETGVSLATLPTLQHSQGHEPMGRRVSRSYSQASTTNSHGGYAVGAMEFGGSPPIAHSRSLRGRRPSVSESVRKSSLDAPSYPPPISTGPYPSQLSRSASTGGPTQQSSPTSYHHQQEPPQSPVTPDAKKANRASLGGGSKKRKPVPAYENHELEVSSPSPVSPSALPAAAFPDLRSNGSDASLRAFANGNGNGNGNGGHYTTRSRTRSRPGSSHSLAQVAAREQELVHKSSFGPGGVEGKPLHYLIPDMPMQQ